MKYFCYVIFACMLSTYFSMDANAQNTLTAQEQKDGWKLLFDGKTTKGWRTYLTDEASSRWKATNGELSLDKSVAEGKGDLITDQEYKDFELSIEWNIDACGNSGIIFNVVEDPKFEYTFFTGPEMQVLDNTCHPDAKIIKHRAGDLYDLKSSSKETVKPAGQWNVAKIVSKNATMEFWLNGTKAVSFSMHSPEWDEMVAKSKFNTLHGFGKALKGHIALQDHGDGVRFRNIKIRELK